MNIIRRIVRNYLRNHEFQLIVKVGLFFALCFLSSHVLANDLLTGTTADAIDTMKGSGRNWAYIIDGALSLGAFAYTKKPFVFFSVLGIALGITAITKLAGG